jgi:hypothetical protein
MSVFTAGGKSLGNGGGYSAAPNLKMLREALKKYRPEDEPAKLPPLVSRKEDAIPGPPAGGLVLYVSWKVLGGREKSARPKGEDNTQRNALGVDRLWVRKDEAEALVAGKFPESLKARMIRYHTHILGKARSLDIEVRDGLLAGSMVPEKGGDPAALRGVLEAKDGKVTRLELLLKGTGRRMKHYGFLAGMEAIPEGETAPVALLFSLADPKDGLSRLPPHRSWRAMAAYLK